MLRFQTLRVVIAMIAKYKTWKHTSKPALFAGPQTFSTGAECLPLRSGLRLLSRRFGVTQTLRQLYKSSMKRRPQ